MTTLAVAISTAFGTAFSVGRITGGGFDPGDLFSGGEQGGWYDFSDMSTLFQDSVGSTPVTAVEQPIGMVLDKRKGLVRGPNTIINGDFSSGASWATTGTWIISGGVASSGAGSSNLEQTGAVEVGKTYEVKINILAPLTNTLNVFVGVASVVAFLAGAVGEVTTIIRATGDTRLILQANAATSIDNVSCREVSGNHLIQATSAARPVWSARKNLLTRTEDFADAAWANTGVTLVTNNATAPDGTLTASTITSTANDTAIRQEGIPTGTLNGQSIIASIWMRAATPHVATIVTRDTPTATDSVAQNVSVTATWQRFDVPHAFTAAGTTASLLIFPKELGSGNPNLPVEIWHPQFERGSTATRYQRVTTSTDYDTAGFPHFARYDGVDDSLNTAATVDFTATDKMGVFAGLSPLSVSATQMIVEYGVDVATVAGSFAAYVENSQSLNSANAGSPVVGIKFARSSVVTAGAPRLFTSTHNLAGVDVAAQLPVLRVAGVQDVFSRTGLSNTGLFGNHTLFTGARNFSSTFLLNGQINQLVILGRTPTAQEITDTEAYITTKTVNV